jgi:hypothetical protein
MKRMILIIILINVPNIIFSENIFNKIFFKSPINGFGTIGSSIYFQKDNKTIFDFSANFLFFGLADYNFKFGIETSLINYQYSNIYNSHCISLFSPIIYYNIYDWLLWTDNFENSEHLLLRIQASMNYFNSYNFSKIDLNNIVYSISLRLIDLDQIMFYLSETFSIEIGYKNINGRHNIYSAIKIDPITFFIVTFGKIKYRKPNPEQHNDT